ncbi:MAG: signal peptidase I [Candidatus Omnitrophica bacterium]|nr:signal peptidase I [Candidatus Omnitrophota bacterium]
MDDWRFFKSDRRAWLEDKWENWIKPLLIAAVLAVGIRTFILGPYKIPTGSMRPNLMEGDRIFVDKLSYRFREPHRGEIIVFKYPLDRKKDFVKRLVATGGETVEIQEGQVHINGSRLESPPVLLERFYYNRDDWMFGKHGQVFRVPEGHLFVLGDNSAQSSDSRNWGFVPRKDLIGRAVVIWWPPSRVRLVKDS